MEFWTTDFQVAGNCIAQDRGSGSNGVNRLPTSKQYGRSSCVLSWYREFQQDAADDRMRSNARTRPGHQNSMIWVVAHVASLPPSPMRSSYPPLNHPPVYQQDRPIIILCKRNSCNMAEAEPAILASHLSQSNQSPSVSVYILLWHHKCSKFSTFKTG